MQNQLTAEVTATQYNTSRAPWLRLDRVNPLRRARGIGLIATRARTRHERTAEFTRSRTRGGLAVRDPKSDADGFRRARRRPHLAAAVDVKDAGTVGRRTSRSMAVAIARLAVDVDHRRRDALLLGRRLGRYARRASARFGLGRLLAEHARADGNNRRRKTDDTDDDRGHRRQAKYELEGLPHGGAPRSGEHAERRTISASQRFRSDSIGLGTRSSPDFL